MDKKEGTYNHCTACKIKKNCCCDFDDGIDNIIATAEEKNILLKRVGKDYEKYFKKIKPFDLTFPLFRFIMKGRYGRFPTGKPGHACAFRRDAPRGRLT